MADEMTNSTEGKKKRMSRLTCTQCESMLLDAADGRLLTEDESHFRLHLADCPDCSAMFADVQKGGAWLEMLKADPPVPPADLLDRILAATSGDPVVSHEVVAQAAQAHSLFGHSQGAKVLPFRMQEPRSRFARMAQTVMQPRFAMTAAMAFFSLALTMNIAGVHITALRASDLAPTNLRKSFWSANNQVVRYYDNLRVVYELESRLHEMQKDSDDAAPQRGVMQKAPENQQQDQPEQQPSRRPGGQPRSEAPQLYRGAPAGPSRSQTQHLFPVSLHVDQQVFRAQVIARGEGVQS